MARAEQIAQLGSWERDLRTNELTWSANVYRMFGLDPDVDQPSYEAFMATVHPDDRDRLAIAQTRAVEDQGTLQIEYRIVHADGSTRWMREVGALEQDDDGTPIRITGVVLEISDRSVPGGPAPKRAPHLLHTLERYDDGVIILDSEWRFVHVNEEAERVMDRPRDEMVGKNFWELYPSQVGSESGREFRRALDEQVPVHFVFRSESSERRLDVNAYPLTEGLAVYFRDVTKSYRDDKEMRLQRAALEAAANSIVITDRDGMIEWFNPAFADTHGVASEEVVGHSPGELIGSNVHSKEFYAEMWKTILSGKVWRGEIVNRRKDGVQITEELTITPVQDARGEISNFIGIKQDITARKEADLRLKEQAALIDQASDAIIVRDLEHNIVFWNGSAESIYGWTRKEVSGRSIAKLLYSDPEAFWDATEQVVREGAWSGELEQRTKDGRVIVVLGRWTLLRDDDGMPRSILAVNTDITKSRTLELHATRAQRLESIGTLAGGIAHDLNNMLAPVMIGLDLLAHGERDEKRLSLLDNMRNSVNHGAGLVQKVLSFARGVDGVRMTLFPEQLLREVHSMLESGVRRNIQVVEEAESNLWPIDGDPTQLHEALLGIAVNGIDAMPEGGTLTMSVRNVNVDAQFAAMHANLEPGPYVCFTITDDGVGIPEDVQARMFEPFYTTKDFGKGTGLGLSASLGSVHSHGGIIEVTSEVGHGSRFQVYIPAALNPSMGELGMISKDDVPSGRGELILIADDEAAVRAITRKTLELNGYKVITAEDGTEAVGLFAQHRHEIRVVITDMMMPSMDGPALVRAIRRMVPDIPVVIWTGRVAEDVMGSVVRLGVAHVLKKPFRARDLLDALEEVLG